MDLTYLQILNGNEPGTLSAPFSDALTEAGKMAPSPTIKTGTPLSYIKIHIIMETENHLEIFDELAIAR